MTTERGEERHLRVVRDMAELDEGANRQASTEQASTEQAVAPALHLTPAQEALLLPFRGTSALPTLAARALEDAKEEASAAARTLLRFAAQHTDEAVDLALQERDWDPRWQIALVLAGAWRLTDTHADIATAFRADRRDVDELFAPEGLTEDGSWALLRTFSGDLQPVRELCLDPHAGLFARWTGLDTVAMLLAEGTVERPTFVEFVNEMIAHEQDPSDYFIAAIASVTNSVHCGEWLPLLKTWAADENVRDYIRRDVQDAIDEADRDPEEQMADWREYCAARNDRDALSAIRDMGWKSEMSPALERKKRARLGLPPIGVVSGGGAGISRGATSKRGRRGKRRKK